MTFKVKSLKWFFVATMFVNTSILVCSASNSTASASSSSATTSSSTPMVVDNPDTKQAMETDKSAESFTEALKQQEIKNKLNAAKLKELVAKANEAHKKDPNKYFQTRRYLVDDMIRFTEIGNNINKARQLQLFKAYLDIIGWGEIECNSPRFNKAGPIDYILYAIRVDSDKERIPFLELFLDHGANPNQRTKILRCIETLTNLIIRYHPDLIDTLLEHSLYPIDLNQVDINGKTLLKKITDKTGVKSVQKLLQNKDL